MTNCYNCGHTGTFVLLVQFALAVPGPDAPDAVADSADTDTADMDSANSDSDSADTGPENADALGSDPGGLSLAVQCPACDSTDVGVAAEDLLARYRSRTTS